MLDPNNTICVLKHDGKEVGRIAATAKNASQYINGLASHYGELKMEYVEDATSAMIDRMVRGTNR